MNKMPTSLGLAALLVCFSAFGETPQRSEDKLATLRALKIDHGTLTTVERDPSGTRTIVKLVLNPAQGSNIHVEVWLPDAEKWNARFLGLGNGGAAGKINPGGLSGMSAAVMPWRPPTWARHRTLTPVSAILKCGRILVIVPRIS